MMYRLVLLLALCGAPQDPESWATLLKDAAAKMEQGADPVDLLEKAVGLLDKEPEKGDALAARAEAKRRLGEIAAKRGEDPEKLFAAALADASRALELDPKSAAGFLARGDARTAACVERRARLEDVKTSELDAAIADYAKAIELQPKHAAALGGRALARQQMALLRFQQQRVFDVAYANALKDFDAAVELDPARAWWRFQRGEARYLLAVHLGYRHEDPREWYRKAAEDYRKAEELDAASLPLYRDHLKVAETRLAEEPGKHAPPERSIEWAKSWEAAKQESKARNTPIWIYVSGGAG